MASTLTRDELITLSENMADAVSSARWSSTLKLQLLGRVHRAECRKVLDANRWYWFQQVNVTPDTNGRCDLADLTTDAAGTPATTGDDLRSLYRIISACTSPNSTQGQFYLQEVTYEDYPNPINWGSLSNVWYRIGTEIQIAPFTPSSPIQFAVSWLPQRADLLSAGTVQVPYVADYELILAYETAAAMLNKGAAEFEAAQALQSQAQMMRNDMMQSIRRLGTKPQRPQPMDDPAQWAG